MTPKKPLADVSLWVLVFSNVFTIVLAISEQWNLSTVMWVYWSQSVIIGIFNFVRILQLKAFSVEGFKINGVPAQETKATKISTAFFFLFHFGIFHLVYMVFLLAGSPANRETGIPFADMPFILLSTGIFFCNHLFSYVLHRRETNGHKPNIGAIMFYPYARIIPMHLTILFGGFVGSALPFFLLLKTGADAVMHTVEHSMFSGKKNT